MDKYEPCPVCNNDGRVPAAFYGETGPPVTCRTCGGSHRRLVGESVVVAVSTGDPTSLRGL